jgi:beta-xylosidase
MSSSADVVKVGERYYMLYEGVRGPGPADVGDNQFALAMARSQTNRIDAKWERFPGNPLLVDLPGNIGLGHADLVIHDGKTILFTSVNGYSRSRFVLVWK